MVPVANISASLVKETSYKVKISSSDQGLKGHLPILETDKILIRLCDSLA